MVLVLLLVFLFGLSSCSGQEYNKKTGKITVAGQAVREKEIRSVFASLSIEQKSSQVLMTGIDGKTAFAPYLNRYFSGVVPGAILLFSYNISDTPGKVHAFLQSCAAGFKGLDTSVPVLFAIDHEGGEVYRTGRVTTRLPSQEFVAGHFSPALARSLYENAGLQLSLLGIRMNLAPVVETLSPRNQVFLGTRAFSFRPDVVLRYARAAISGYREAGVLTVLKHFPGNSAGDPHSELPCLDIGLAEFRSVYVKPFRELLGENPDAILASNIVVTSLDPGVPFCLSKKGVTGIIRDSLKFDGLVITDDISMGAIKKAGFTSDQAAVRALEAGCDMIMSSDADIRSIANAIASKARSDIRFSSRLDEAVLRILRVKSRAGLVKTVIPGYSKSPKKDTSVIPVNQNFDSGEWARVRANGDKILEGKK
jgi:beta-N-acetylhexosaminidase